MPYVVRDEKGSIISILAKPQDGAERLDATEQELKEFFQSEDPDSALREVLVASDLSFVRVLEDLISVLLDKNVLMLTDLPEAAQRKILQRKDIRGYLQDLSGLIADEREETLLI